MTNIKNQTASPLVSIVMPCYNVQNKITPMLESLCRQTYRNLHLVFVDDGSTDGTAGEIKNYEITFLKLGYEVEYIYQENKGIGGAINTGLKRIRGKYFTWPDPDDWLTDDSIEKKLSFLEHHPQYAMVTSNGYIFEYPNLEYPQTMLSYDMDNRNKHMEKEFLRTLRLDTLFCPGTHMIRTADFMEINPQMDIYESRGGQNIQILLPMYYFKRCCYWNQPLYNYVIYTDSHSRGDDTFDKVAIRHEGFYDIFCQTLKRMGISEKERKEYLAICRMELNKRLYFSAYRFHDYNKMKEFYCLLKGTKMDTLTLEIFHYLVKNHQGGVAAILKIKRMIRKYEKNFF